MDRDSTEKSMRVSSHSWAARSAFVKLIVHKADSDRVVGMHVCGPHAGETTVTYFLTYLPILCPALS